MKQLVFKAFGFFFLLVLRLSEIILNKGNKLTFRIEHNLNSIIELGEEISENIFNGIMENS